MSGRYRYDASTSLNLHVGHVYDSTPRLSPQRGLPLPIYFTGKERDTESGNDYFGARYYSSAMGRFMSPDWSAKEEPVPYAKLDDPQSLNLYAYVLNNPLDRTDPDGHQCDWCEKAKNALSGNGLRTNAEVSAILNHPNAPPPDIHFTPVPPSASLHTDMSGHTTTFTTTDQNGKSTSTQIETHNDVAHNAKPGAADAYSTSNINGVSNRHAGEVAYGPKGAFIDTGDSRGREIHGGGTKFGNPGAFADHQGWAPTEGCTRGQNIDVIHLGQSITTFKNDNAGVPIPYSRN
jgi:RHS repeat-associated protein